MLTLDIFVNCQHHGGQIEKWKDKPVGTPVFVVRDNGCITETKTRSEPWVLGDGRTVVILLEGFAGGYLLSRVRLGAPAPRQVGG